LEEQNLENVNILSLSYDIKQLSIEESSNSDTAIGIILFLIALVGAISNLPCFLMVSEYSFEIRIIWRFSFAILGAFIWFLYDLYCNSNEICNEYFFTNTFKIALLSILNLIYIYTVYYAVINTFVAHTLLLCSIAPTFLSTWKLAKGLPYSKIDYIGIGINVFGAYLCCCEAPPILPDIITTNKSSIWYNFGKPSMLIGDFLAIASSGIYAFYISFSTSLFSSSNKPAISFYLLEMSLVIIGLCTGISFIKGENILLLSADGNTVFTPLFLNL